jgi:hypothetical protein
MSKRLIATDAPILAKTEVEASDGKLVVCNTQDAEPIVERNKRWQSEGQGVGKNFRHVAHIPAIVYLDLEKKGYFKPGNEKLLSKWLNDPDNRFFRVWGGRI